MISEGHIDAEARHAGLIKGASPPLPGLPPPLPGLPAGDEGPEGGASGECVVRVQREVRGDEVRSDACAGRIFGVLDLYSWILSRWRGDWATPRKRES